MNELKIRADALRWYLAEKRDDPRIPDAYTDEGQERLRVLCIYQALTEPGFTEEMFDREITKLKPKGSGREWSLAHGWYDPDDKSLLQLPLWSPYWETVYRDICKDLHRLKREGFTDRAKKVESVLSAIEAAFPEMVEHMANNAGEYLTEFCTWQEGGLSEVKKLPLSVLRDGSEDHKTSCVVRRIGLENRSLSHFAKLIERNKLHVSGPVET